MQGINAVRERDENFEKRTADLLGDMRRESSDMASLISSLSDKIREIPEQEAKQKDPEEDRLLEIRDLMSRLNDSVDKVSETLNRLSEEV